MNKSTNLPIDAQVSVLRRVAPQKRLHQRGLEFRVRPASLARHARWVAILLVLTDPQHDVPLYLLHQVAEDVLAGLCVRVMLLHLDWLESFVVAARGERFLRELRLPID